MKITKGKVQTAVRVVIYGTEGIGKSTLASNFPEPLFLDLEGGTNQLDIARTEITNWTELTSAIDEVIADPSLCQTLVIDTADRADMYLSQYLIDKNGVDSIEKVGGGYGKGFTLLCEYFQKDLLFRLDKVIAKGINVVLTAHAAARKYESPEDPPYDRWELKVSKKVAPIIKEWSDLLLFCDYQTVVVESASGKGKVTGSGKRMMHANHKPTYDAKNRFGLPDDMPLSFEPLKDIFKKERQVEKTVLDINNPETGIIEDNMEEDVFTVFKRHLKEQGITQKAVLQWMADNGRGEFKKIEDLSVPYVTSLDSNIEILKKQINGGK